MTKIITMAEDQAPTGGKIPEHPGRYHHKGRLAMVDAEGALGWISNLVLTQRYGASPDKNIFQWLTMAFMINEKLRWLSTCVY